MLAYKVTNINNGSAVVDLGNPFYRQYSRDFLVDMGMVFDNLGDAESFVWRSGSMYHKIWECEVSEMIEIDVIADLKYMNKFWSVWTIGPRYNIYRGHSWLMPAPRGTHIGFDIRLTKLIKGWRF